MGETMVGELQDLMSLLSCVRYNGTQHSVFSIDEPDKNAVLKSVRIHPTPEHQWFMFDPDRGRGKLRAMSPLLNPSCPKSVHRACDAVIVTVLNPTQRPAELTVLYVELKSESPQNFADQFKATRCFVQYLLALMETFFDRSLRLTERFVVLHAKSNTPSIRKRRTQIGSSAAAKSTPEKPYKRPTDNGARVYLNELLKA